MVNSTLTGDKSPIIIVGCGRAGTTLLATMLNAHPEIDIPRSAALYSIYGPFVPVPTGLAHLPDSRWRRLLRLLVTDAGVRAWKYPPTMADVDIEVPAQNFGAAFRLLHEYHARKSGKKEWGAKLLGGEFFIERLIQDFPNARFVRCVRDGRAVALSLVENDFGPTTLAGGARHWVSSMRAWDKAKQYSQEDVFYSLRYEDLITDTENCLRRLLAFLEIPWHDDCLKYHQSEFAEMRSKDYEHANLAKVPDPSRLDRALKILQKSQIGKIERIAENYLVLYKYPLVTKEHERRTGRESLGKKIIHKAKHISQYIFTKDRVRRASFFQRHLRWLRYSIWPI